MDTNLRDTRIFWYTDSQGRARSLDLARQDEAGDWVTVYGRPPQNLGNVQVSHPSARLSTHEEFKVEHDNSWRHPPCQITEEDYWHALEVLPPLGYVVQQNGRCESFKLRELQSGDMTAIFARSGDTYWRMMDNVSTPHEEIMEAVMTAQEEIPTERQRM